MDKLSENQPSQAYDNPGLSHPTHGDSWVDDGSHGRDSSPSPPFISPSRYHDSPNMIHKHSEQKPWKLLAEANFSSLSVGFIHALKNTPAGAGEEDDVEILGEEEFHPSDRSSIGSISAPDLTSHRGSSGSLSNLERLEIMARKSLPYIQTRRQSTASAYIREPLTATTDDRNWSWRYLRERFRLKDLEDLFDHYQLRLHHAMFIVFLLLQLVLSISAVIALLISQHPPVELVPELTGHSVCFIMCCALLASVYDETTFRKFPSLHIVMSGLVILAIFTTDVTLTVYFHENSIEKDGMKDLRFGNMIYLLLVVYVYLPIPRKWQVILLALLLSAGYLALGYYAIHGDTSDAGPQHLLTKMVVDGVILCCVNMVGVYWRFMSEVAFRRAFLDKRGNLESKFKLDAEKKREEGLLLSILPKSIMQQVKSDFRNMIERTLFNTTPISKTNPFPNLYVNRHEMVSILYADIVNFTPLTTKLSVDQLVEMLNDLFGKFDTSAETNGCLRIKILGDCYYCVCGVPEYDQDHAHNCVKVGLDMIDIIREVREERGVNVDMRIGIHSGSVLSGLIGVRKWQFDVWSNDVTIANHMEQTGRAGRIHVTHRTRELLAGHDYGFEPSDGRKKDQLLQDEDIDTFLIVPKTRPPTRRVSQGFHGGQIKRVSLAVDREELSNLYEGDVRAKVTKVNLPGGAARGSILARRRSTHTEAYLNTKRRTVVTDNALLSFQRIMGNSMYFMERAIESMPLRKYDQWFRPEGINPLLLTFNQGNWELPLLRQPDPLFKLYVLCASFIFIAIFLTQELLMPANTWGWVAGVVCVAVFLLVGPLCWVSTVHQLIVDPHNDREFEVGGRHPVVEWFYGTSKHVIKSIGLRACLFLVVNVALYAAAVVNVVECSSILYKFEDWVPSNSTVTKLRSITSTSSPSPVSPPLDPHDIPALCCDPWYFTYSCTLTLLVAWTFFRVHFLLKLAMYIAIVIVYGVFVLGFTEDVFSHAASPAVCPRLTVSSLGLSPGLGHFTFVLTIFCALHIMDRQMEYIMRLDFQWKQKLEQEQKEAQTTHFANKLLLQNILPLHVADMYLNRQGATDELYHESYEHVGVIFASIPNYGEFYRENEMNEDGKMCLKVLNEIISDFDMLTYETQYLTVEKIKVVGSTYMAACGLQPGRKYSDDSNFEERDRRENVATLTRFAAAMFEKLQSMNREHLQDFRLRVGIDVGPVIAGVVGAQKPMYDIWGNTVNVASRMDYTGEMGKIHVTKEAGEILQEQGWDVECRGEIFVKGKGYMTTYFVDPSNVPPKVHPDILSANNNNCKEEESQRRSSEKSIGSLKDFLKKQDFLTVQRGSLDIRKSSDQGSQVDSVSSYRKTGEFNEWSGSGSSQEIIRKQTDDNDSRRASGDSFGGWTSSGTDSRKMSSDSFKRVYIDKGGAQTKNDNDRRRVSADSSNRKSSNDTGKRKNSEDITSKIDMNNFKDKHVQRKNNNNKESDGAISGMKFTKKNKESKYYIEDEFAQYNPSFEQNESNLENHNDEPRKHSDDHSILTRDTASIGNSTFRANTSPKIRANKAAYKPDSLKQDMHPLALLKEVEGNSLPTQPSIDSDESEDIRL